LLKLQLAKVGAFFESDSIETMSVPRIVWDIGRKSRFFHTPCIRCPARVPVGILPWTFGTAKTRMVGQPNGEIVWWYIESFRQNTDRHLATA